MGGFGTTNDIAWRKIKQFLNDFQKKPEEFESLLTALFMDRTINAGPFPPNARCVRLHGPEPARHAAWITMCAWPIRTAPGNEFEFIIPIGQKFWRWYDRFMVRQRGWESLSLMPGRGE